MDLRLQKYDVFSSPLPNRNNKFNLPLFVDRSLASLLRYKNEPLKQSPLQKTFKQQGEGPDEKIQQLLFSNSSGKLSYSNSIKNLHIFPENQLDNKAIKLLPQNRHYLKSNYQVSRLLQNEKNSQITQNISDLSNSTVQLKFCSKSVKSQFKANVMFYKKTNNFSAQVQLYKHEELKKTKKGTQSNILSRLSKRIELSPSGQQNTDHSMFSTTFRENFLKSQKSNLYQKPQSQEKSARNGNKRTQSVHHQDDHPKDVVLDCLSYNKRQ